MNKVERLLKKLCPNGVEWEKIDKIFDLKNGYTPSKNNTEFWTNGTIPWFRLEDIRQNGRILDNAIQSVSHNALIGGKVIPANSLILSTTATIGEVALITVPFICNQQLTAISINSEYKNLVNIKFYFYYFQILGNKMKKGISTGSFPIISVSKLKKLKIPIPPLEIQEEIVKILDKFTDYVTELTTELTLRQKQYHYYRNKLLSFDNQFYKVEWKTLESISISISTGVTPKKSNHEYYVGGTIPWLRTNEVRNNEITKTDMFVTEKALKETSIKWISENSVIVAISGATAGRVGINKIPITTNQHCCCLTIDSSLANYKYVFYWLLNKNEDILELKQGARGDLNMGIIKKLSIPIPSLEIQSRIVQVLDNFDAVCNDLNIGLPKEIELRQKQYEFFRDKLLTFAAEGVYTDSTVQTRHN